MQAEQGKENLINTAEELRLQKIELEKMVVELRLKFDQAEKRSAELREAEEKKHMEEVQFLKKTNMQLKVRMYVCICIIFEPNFQLGSKIRKYLYLLFINLY